MTAPMPPELPDGQEDERPDLGLLLLVVVRLLNRLADGHPVDRERARAVRNAVRRYRQGEPE